MADVFVTLDTAEFLITHLEPQPGGGVRTTVRFDLSGTAVADARVERIGQWQMRWVPNGPRWAIAEWTALDAVQSRSAIPIFSEATTSAFGGIRAFDAQLTPGLDDVDRPSGRGVHARRHGASRRLCRRRGRRRSGRHLRLAAVRPSQQAPSQQRRWHVHGHHRRRRAERARRHLAVAVAWTSTTTATRT